MSSMGQSAGGGTDWGAVGGGIGSIGTGIAGLFAAGHFGQAASTYAEDVNLSKESTALKEYSANVQSLLGQGSIRNAYASGNLKTSGSALDALAEQARLASINKSQIQIQGTIQANDYAMQEANAKSQETSSIIGGVTGILSGAAMMGGI